MDVNSTSWVSRLGANVDLVLLITVVVGCGLDDERGVAAFLFVFFFVDWSHCMLSLTIFFFSTI